MRTKNAVVLTSLILAATTWTPLVPADEPRVDSNAEAEAIGTLVLEVREQREGSDEEVQRLEIAITDKEDAIASIDQEALTDEMRAMVDDGELAEMTRAVIRLCHRNPSAHIEIKRQRWKPNWSELPESFEESVKFGSTWIEVKCGGSRKKKGNSEENTRSEEKDA